MNILEFNIEKADTSDALDIAQINAISWTKAYYGIFPNHILDSISIEKWAEGLKFQLQRNALVLKISFQGKIVGFSLLCKKAAYQEESLIQGEINALYIHPDVWRKGFGKKLCLASLNALEQLGFKEAILWTLEKNVTAQKFYESLGFKRTGSLRECPIVLDSDIREIQYIKKIQ